MSHNFLQFDPTKNNMMSDAGYNASNYRKNGAQAGVAPAPVHNKLFYQSSTFITAFAQMMLAKGYTLSDADMTALTTVLSNLMTTADMTPYALVTQLEGYIAKASVIIKIDNAFILPAEFYKTVEANKSTAIQFTLPLFSDVPNGAWVKIKNIGAGLLTLNATIDGSVNPTLAQHDEITVFSDGTALRGRVISGSSASDWGSSLTENGYQKYPSGLLEQWGKYDSPFSSQTTFEITFPLEFLTTPFSGITQIIKDDSNDNFVDIRSMTTTKMNCRFHRSDLTGIGTTDGVYWRAVGKWK